MKSEADLLYEKYQTILKDNGKDSTMELEAIKFKEVYNKLKKAQRLNPKDFQLVEKHKLISMLQDTVKNTSKLLFNLENGLNYYEPPEHIRSEKVFFEDHSLDYDTLKYQRIYSTLAYVQIMSLNYFNVISKDALVKELQTTVKKLTTLLIKLESNIKE